MTEEEHAIWHAAYAAAFVADFDRAYFFFSREGVKSLLPEDEGSPFDAAARCTNAERSWTIADRAVQAFRKWKKEEEPGGPRP